MSSFKDKSQVFIIGLMAGLLVAGGFFILKLDNYFKELSFYKSISKTFSSDPKISETTVKDEESTTTKEKKSNFTNSQNKKVQSDASNSKKDFVLDSDTLRSKFFKDSLASTSVNSDDIVVRKDELLSTKTFDVINLSPILNRNNTKDSLLQKISGIKDDKNVSQQFFNVEFWQSPLNYRGYKMSKYKIILYGIESVEGLKVFKIDDLIYLKNGNAVFKLDYSSEFKPYDRITDENIVSKLK